MGVRDPGSYPEFLSGCKRPGKLFRNFYVGVRDSGSHPEFLCGCKRPVEISEIYVWMKEARSVGRKFLLLERMKTHGQVIT